MNITHYLILSTTSVKSSPRRCFMQAILFCFFSFWKPQYCLILPKRRGFFFKKTFFFQIYVVVLFSKKWIIVLFFSSKNILFFSFFFYIFFFFFSPFLLPFSILFVKKIKIKKQKQKKQETRQKKQQKCYFFSNKIRPNKIFLLEKNKNNVHFLKKNTTK